MKKLFVWLGSGRTKKHKIGTNGCRLDQAAKAGLPVPNGGILLDTFLRQLVKAQIVVEENASFHAPNPLELYESLYSVARFPRMGGKIAVRPVGLQADKAYFDDASQTNVDSNDPQQLTEALCAVWSFARSQDGRVRQDVLLQEMIEERMAGVAFSEQGYEDDLLCMPQGGQRSVPQLQAGESPSADLPPFAQRLQRLMRGVRTTFGHADWQVDWVDDGVVCWLMQLQPVTQPPLRLDVRLPVHKNKRCSEWASPLLTGIVASSNEALLDAYRHLDPALSAKRALFFENDASLQVNASLLSDLLRKWGFSTKPLAQKLTENAVINTGIRPFRLLRHLPVLLRLGRRRLSRGQSSLPSGQVAHFGAAVDAIADLFMQAAGDPFGLIQLVVGEPPQGAIRQIDALRHQLLQLGEQAARAGQLPSAEAIWLLTPEEVRSLDDGRFFTTADIASRRESGPALTK